MTPSVDQPDGLYEMLEPHLAPARLAPYVAATDGSRRQAIRLYQWNIRVSGAVYEALHVVEVVLRNAIDAQLCGWNSSQVDPQTGKHRDRDWLLDPAPLLRRLVRDHELTKAHQRAERAIRHQRRPVAHADLLAQLSFGTWRFLLPDRDPGRQRLWDDALHVAFPHLDRSPQELVNSVHGIYQLRNRVAHLEPLLRSGMIRTQFTNMRTVLNEVDPVAEQWFVSNQRVTATLRGRPATENK
ncbi:Abi family protein [Pseudactinotalea sp. HY158]|uniref:Abi family protein n=1 Tax=Pseudactinotalea sp. HY158 TaxID=2654547 RepID=UPI0018921484|nr:Abi family protein [Pseudactinotalea sp. HY158]